jgi:hypothetical protein
MTSSELAALVLCIIAIMDIVIGPFLFRWYYIRQQQKKDALTTDSDSLEMRYRRYELPSDIRRLIWFSRAGGIIILALAAFIYFSDFLG